MQKKHVDKRIHRNLAHNSVGGLVGSPPVERGSLLATCTHGGGVATGLDAVWTTPGMVETCHDSPWGSGVLPPAPRQRTRLPLTSA